MTRKRNRKGTHLVRNTLAWAVILVGVFFIGTGLAAFRTITLH